MSMPSGELVNEELRAMGDLVPDGIPDHYAETGSTEQRGQIPMTLPPVPARTGRQPAEHASHGSVTG